ncbi:MAG: aspartic proteinase IV [Benniella sp.]|nr:MAG: aspartic proteinase IV [Benniella sp.]
MKITTFLTVAIATALTLTQAAPTEEFAGHKISLSLNPDHKKDYRSAMTKLTRRYPQMKWRRDPRRPFRDYLAGAKVTVTNYGPDYEYFGPVQVGSPGQTLQMFFDTGSSDIWFPSSKCETEACKKRTRFDASKSSSFRKDPRTWEIKYADGSAAGGDLGSDIVNIGGMKIRQTIGLAMNISSEFARAPEDGMFGLAFKSLQSVDGVNTYMDNAIADRAVALPVISVYLPSKRMNGGEGGYYLFGAIERKRYIGDLTWVPVTKARYWQVALDGAKFNGQSVGNFASSAIVDTGTTLVIVSDALAAALHKNIQGAFVSESEGGWVVPCNLTSSTGFVSFTLARKDFHIPLADLAWDPSLDDSSLCFSGIQGGLDDMWILGDMFIKNNYCVFDHSKNPKIGIAPVRY